MRTQKRRKTRRFVKLTRAHLEMSGRFTDDEDKRYALTALCVRVRGGAAVVEATNGSTAWRFPAEWVDAGDLPVFTGDELAGDERMLIDPASARCCLRLLPKSHPLELGKSAYLAVDGGVGVLHTLDGASFRLTSYGEDARWPDFEGMIPEEGGPSITLRADLLGKIASWASKLPAGSGEEQALTLSFHPYQTSKVMVRFSTGRDGGPVGVLAPFGEHRVANESISAWKRAWKK